MIHNQVAGYNSNSFSFIYLIISLTKGHTHIFKIKQFFFGCRYTRTYANNMTFATVKASLTCSYYMKKIIFLYLRVSQFLWVWFGL